MVYRLVISAGSTGCSVFESLQVGVQPVSASAYFVGFVDCLAGELLDFQTYWVRRLCVSYRFVRFGVTLVLLAYHVLPIRRLVLLFKLHLLCGIGFRLCFTPRVFGVLSVPRPGIIHVFAGQLFAP